MNLFIDASKYVLTLLMAGYTYLNFRYFGVKEEKREALCRRQAWLLYLLHGTAYVVLYLQTGQTRTAVLYVAQVLFFVLYRFFSRVLYPKASRILINNMCMLLAIGFFMLTRLNFDRAVRQFGIAALSAAVCWAVPWLLDRMWQLSRIPWLYGLLGLALLAVVWAAGSTSYGAQLSLDLGPVSVQPSEFVKISFVCFTAAMFYRSVSFRQTAVTTVMAALHVLVLVLSRDLGSALLFFTVYLCMLFAATSSWLYLGAGILSGSGAAVLAYRLFSHVRVRVSAWQNPWADIDNTGYQITQSLFAIGTGGWFGMGLGQGMPQRIPVVEKDFMFSAISEELGAVFALCLVLICLGCFLQFVMIACRMQASFYKLTAFGLGAMYIFQVFLSVGGAVKFIPSTGVTLPFVSYGGSSMLATCILFAVMQGMYILKQDEEEEKDDEESL